MKQFHGLVNLSPYADVSETYTYTEFDGLSIPEEHVVVTVLRSRPMGGRLPEYESDVFKVSE
jgi:hypothetical protein